MNTLNLIPPKIKKEQMLNQISGLVLSIGFFVVIIIILAFGALYATNYLVEKNLDETNNRYAEEEMKINNLKNIEDDVNKINKKLDKISEFKKSGVNWPAFLSEVDKSTPEKLKIDSLQLNTKTNIATISGSAETRRDIVKFQQKLNSLDYFNNLVFATSSYSKSESMYTFNMTGDFNK